MRNFIFFLFLHALIFNPFLYAAALTGKVNYTGAPVSPKPIDTNADPSCGKAGLQSEEIVLNSDGTLKNVFIYVKQGLEGKTFETSKEKVVLDQQGCRYTPHVFGLGINQALEIRNSDSTLHNVHARPKESKPFNLGMPIKGMKLDRKFDKPEVMVKFKCDVHPWMTAYAGVLDHPFYAVSGDSGTFEIKDLPPGKYTLEAWHEKLGTQTQEVSVDESGKATADFNFAG
jgi:hypothetical protein